MNGRHQTSFISPNIENGDFPHLVCGWENRPNFRKGREVAAFHLPVPVLQSTSGFGMAGSKLIQPFPRDDMHLASPAMLFIVSP